MVPFLIFFFFTITAGLCISARAYHVLSYISAVHHYVFLYKLLTCVAYVLYLAVNLLVRKLLLYFLFILPVLSFIFIVFTQATSLQLTMLTADELCAVVLNAALSLCVQLGAEGAASWQSLLCGPQHQDYHLGETTASRVCLVHSLLTFVFVRRKMHFTTQKCNRLLLRFNYNIICKVKAETRLCGINTVVSALPQSRIGPGSI